MARVTLAQVAPVLGDVAENARRASDHIGAARDEGADLVVLPELVLSGYSLGRVDDDVSRPADGPELTGLAEEAKGIGCVVGFAEAGRVHTYNSAAYLERGAVRHVHRKLYLPTYDIWEERKHFTPGKRHPGLRHGHRPGGDPHLQRRLAAGAGPCWPSRTGRGS